MGQKKQISLISLNKPGLIASLKLIDPLLSIDPNYQITLYTKYNDKQLYSEEIQVVFFENIDDIVFKVWNTSDIIIWLTATGIVVRKIANLLDNKTKDPAVLIFNLDLTQVIPLLSGHIGGANDIAIKLSNVIRDLSVFITTATDSRGCFAIDLFCKKHTFFIENIENISSFSNQLLNEKKVNFISLSPIIDLAISEGLDPSYINQINIIDLEKADYKLPTVVIASKEFNRRSFFNNRVLKVSLNKISIGVGLNKNTSCEELIEDFDRFLEYNKIFLNDIDSVSSYEAKVGDLSLMKLGDYIGKKISFFSKTEILDINSKYTFSKSEAQRYFSIPGVAEPCSILASENKKLLIPKVKFKNTTFAASF